MNFERTLWRGLLASATALLLLTGCGANPVPVGGAADRTQQTWEPEAVETPAYEPKPADFELTVKVLKKKCFGSAGCSITYRIDVAYMGLPLDPEQEYEVIYEVRGGEDGPQVNTLTVQGEDATVDAEEDVSTSSSKATLTAVATEVL
jgi:hypothetical protein